MPLTPADVHNVAFSKPPIGKRGYNEDEVDAFLDLVENELTRLIERTPICVRGSTSWIKSSPRAAVPALRRRPPRQSRRMSPNRASRRRRRSRRG